MHIRTSYLVFLALLIIPLDLSAQDQFGSAVGISGGDVLVVKPSAGQGPATVFVYGKRTGEWQLAHRLTPENGRESGEGFSASLSANRDRILVGAGDAGAVIAAHEFRRTVDGWAAGVRVPLNAGNMTSPGQRQLDMAGLMRIIQPPRRTIAANSQHLAVGVIGGAAGANGVRIASRETQAPAWRPFVALDVDGIGADALFGAAVDVHDMRVAVGAPRAAHGATYIFEMRDGTWRLNTRLTADSTTAGFGSSLLFVDNALLVGAPGTRDTAGVVAVFQRDQANAARWTRTATLTAPDGHPGNGFGAAMASSGNTVWIGAPEAQGTGKVYAYEANSAGTWTVIHSVNPGNAVGASFGAAIAASTDLLVVGAPQMEGGRGRVAVFEAGAAGWSAPVWLSAFKGFETIAGREVSCQAGTAAGFDCGNVDLLAFMPIAALGGDVGEGVSDLWGWTDPITRREYAMVGRNGGVAFVEVTDPISPVYVGDLPANRSGARDLKVYRDHLFFTGDGAGNHGLIVFDLARLREVDSPPVRFTADTRYDGIASAHNLVIDTDAGFAYPVGASGGGETCGGGLHMVDIRDPLQPRFAGCYTDTEGLIWPGRTHDAQCVIYRGPDQKYRGQQICFASNETALRIVDVTEKGSPVPIAAATYPGLSYVHQGWLTDDQRYFYLDDELDELVGQANRTRTMIWDIAELDDPVLVGEYLGPDGATDHNLYVKGNRMYQANYQAGMRVVDISDPESPIEIGFFDTTPYDGNPPGFTGAWTAYPYFDSGTVIVSSMREGLFVLRPRPPALVP